MQAEATAVEHPPQSEAQPRALGRRSGKWLLGEILAPFLVSRGLLVLVAWFTEVFVANPRYPAADAARRGWQFSSFSLLDVWGRWDSGWYMKIALGGYAPAAAYERVPSTIAFFPLFPMSVRAILHLLPESARTQTAAMIVGVVLANVALLFALVAIRQLVAQFAGDGAARRSVLYVLTFPTSFFLSCFYPESLFLAASACACLLATRNRWFWASIVGILAVLSRPYGVMVVLPMGWIYLSSIGWKLSRVRPNSLFLLLVPAALLGYLLLIRPLSGHLAAPFAAQAAWHRHFAWPWTTLSSTLYFEGNITRVQQVLAVSIVVLSVWALVRLPSRAYGLYALAITVPSLLSATLMGIGRHAVVVFPLYMILAVISRRERVHLALLGLNLTVQVLFMTAWVRFYPVV
jgi:hypothetical protein